MDLLTASEDREGSLIPRLQRGREALVRLVQDLTQCQTVRGCRVFILITNIYTPYGLN